jgi:energy-coupling factor transporter ATP-binding protein EcfA2
MPLISTDRFTLRYPFCQRKVLDKITFSVSRGEKVLLLGPSGVGKSTLALALNGVIPRSVEAETEGEIEVCGLVPEQTDPRTMCGHVGIMFQDPEAQFCMSTVKEEVLFGLENMGLSKAEMEERLERSLSAVGLADRQEERLAELSGGMKQKLALACLLAMDPEVMILDEPTANLDPESSAEVFSLLGRLSAVAGKTLIFIEHKLDELLPFLDRIVVLGGAGGVIADGKPRNVFREDLDLLRTEGIWVPQVCEAAAELERDGMVWPTFPLTMEEWETGLFAAGICVPNDRIDTAAARSPGKRHLLEFKQVSFSYGGKRQVLERTDFTVGEGEFVALLGASGAGKSTISKLAIRMLGAETGVVRFNGVDITELDERRLFTQIGYVFQNPEHQFICDTVEHELAYGLRKQGQREDVVRERVEQLLRRFGLLGMRESNPFALSQGQKRRLSVATMLMHEQCLLLLDEPTFGQDRRYTEELASLLMDIHQEGKTILMITHDMELVARCATNVLLLHKGSIAFSGTPLEFFTDGGLLRSVGMKPPLSWKLRLWMAAYREGAGTRVGKASAQ